MGSLAPAPSSSGPSEAELAKRRKAEAAIAAQEKREAMLAKDRKERARRAGLGLSGFVRTSNTGRAGLVDTGSSGLRDVLGV